MVKTNSSSPDSAGITAQYVLFIWDNQEESHPNRNRKQLTHVWNRRLLISVRSLFLTGVFQLYFITHNPTSTVDQGAVPIASGDLLHQRSAISHSKVTILSIPEFRKLSHDKKSSVVYLWRILFPWSCKT